MVRSYAPKNRYCRNTKLSEAEFEEAVAAFFNGAGAAALARANGRSERSMRTLFARLRQRLMDDDYLSGWMGGGTGELPPDDDQIWPLIYDCLADCPAYEDQYVSTSPAYVSRFRGLEPDGDHKQKMLTFIRKRHAMACRSCPIGLRFKFDISVREEWGKHELRCGGIPRNAFKPHYFEIMFRTNIRVKSSKFPEGVRNMSVGVILERLAEKPL